MRFKVGDKVKTKGDEWFNKGEVVEIIEVYKDDSGTHYFCKGESGEWCQDESDLEPLNSHLTFQQKLDRFKREPIGFLVKSKEIADELAKVLDSDSNFKDSDGSTWKSLCTDAFNLYGDKAYICYNGRSLRGSSDQLISGSLQTPIDELLDITLEELKSYNAPQTLEDKLALFKAGTHVLHTPTQEIYDKLMVELEKRGYVWTNGKKPAEPKGYWAVDIGIQYNYYGDSRFVLRKIKRAKEDGLEILTLTPEDFTAPQVITITTDGYHRTTAESNGVTAESLCNPTDTFDISKGSHIALKRLLEKLDEGTPWKLGDLSGEPEGFHVGDIVEVIGNEWGFTKNPVGLQGVVTRPNKETGGAQVKLPNSDESQYFFARELKLVRKYNA